MNKANQNEWLDENHPDYGKISGWKNHDAHIVGQMLKAGGKLPTRGHLQVQRAGPEAVFAAVYVPAAGPQGLEVRVQWRDVQDRPDGVALEIASGLSSYTIRSLGRHSSVNSHSKGERLWRGFRMTRWRRFAWPPGASPASAKALVTVEAEGNGCVERDTGGAMEEALDRYYPEAPHARTCFGASGFHRRGSILQVDCIAYID